MGRTAPAHEHQRQRQMSGVAAPEPTLADVPEALLRVLVRLRDKQRHPSKPGTWTAPCPCCCEPMDVSAGFRQPVLLYCRNSKGQAAPCTFAAKMGALGLQEKDACRPTLTHAPADLWSLPDRVLDHVQKHPSATFTEIRVAVRRRKGDVKAAIQSLLAAGKLEDRGHAGHRRYHVAAPVIQDAPNGRGILAGHPERGILAAPADAALTAAVTTDKGRAREDAPTYVYAGALGRERNVFYVAVHAQEAEQPNLSTQATTRTRTTPAADVLVHRATYGPASAACPVEIASVRYAPLPRLAGWPDDVPAMPHPADEAEFERWSLQHEHLPVSELFNVPGFHRCTP